MTGYKISYENDFGDRFTMSGNFTLEQAGAMVRQLFRPDWGAVSIEIKPSGIELDTRSFAEMEAQVIA